MTQTMSGPSAAETRTESGTATATATAVPQPVKLAQPAQPDKGGWIWGTGRRKTAVARVRIKPGSGKFLINGRTIEQYFTEMRDRQDVQAPLKVTNTLGRLDVIVRVCGGGYAGQAGAIVLGLARALKGYDPTLEGILREHGMLTRDAREVERKKPGRRKARRGFQWAKR